MDTMALCQINSFIIGDGRLGNRIVGTDDIITIDMQSCYILNGIIFWFQNDAIVRA